MVGVGAALTVGGVAAAVLLSEDNSLVLEKPAAVVQAKEKSDRYKAIAEKYAEQVEAGRKYVGERYDLLIDQVEEAVVVDEILPGYGPKKPGGLVIPPRGAVIYLGESILPADESALFAAYAHRNGYSLVVVEQSGKIHELYGAVFCDEKMRKAADVIINYMKRSLSDGSEIAFRDIHQNDSGNLNLYNVEVIDGWNNQKREPNLFGRYVVDTGTNNFSIFSGVYFSGNHECK